MEEHCVTVDRETRSVPRPFLVIATQNPIELEGTYPLPEAQLDRFLIKTTIGHPDLVAEIEVLRNHSSSAPKIDQIQPLLSASAAGGLVAYAESIHASDGILGYIAQIAEASRRLPELRLGVSPRGSIGLLRSSRVWAASEGRSFVTPEDVKFLVEPVLGHRVILTPEAELAGRSGGELVRRAADSVKIPASQ